MQLTWVFLVVSTLAIIVAAQENTLTENIPNVKSKKSSSSPGEVQNKSQPLLGFETKWPFKFNQERAKAEIPEIEKILATLGQLWNTISGLIDVVGSKVSGGRKMNLEAADNVEVTSRKP